MENQNSRVYSQNTKSKLHLIYVFVIYTIMTPPACRQESSSPRQLQTQQQQYRDPTFPTDTQQRRQTFNQNSNINTNALGSLPAKCTAQNICSIERTLVNDRGEKILVPYSFKYRPAQNGAPTVVYIPGGPGQTSTETDLLTWKSFPQHYGIILTDPRFTGINQHKDAMQFKGAMTTQGVAEDIILAVLSVGIKDYILYGVSYGTLPATVAAARVAHLNQNRQSSSPPSPHMTLPLPLPRAVVLEGTAGHAIDQMKYYDTYIKEWAKFVQQAPPEKIQLFQKRIQEIFQKNQFNPNQVASVMQVFMLVRHAQDGEDNLNLMITAIGEFPYEKATKVIQNTLDKINKSFLTPPSALFHNVINCKESFFNYIATDINNINKSAEEWGLFYDIESNELKINPDDNKIKNCLAYAQKNEVHYYDSKLYQIASPIIYIHGSDDVALPVEHVKYHFEHQTHAQEKHLLIVPQGSHTPLDKELGQCTAQFWHNLSQSAKSAAESLTPCFNPAAQLNQLNHRAQ